MWRGETFFCSWVRRRNGEFGVRHGGLGKELGAIVGANCSIPPGPSPLGLITTPTRRGSVFPGALLPAVCHAGHCLSLRTPGHHPKPFVVIPAKRGIGFSVSSALPPPRPLAQIPPGRVARGSFSIGAAQQREGQIHTGAAVWRGKEKTAKRVVGQVAALNAKVHAPAVLALTVAPIA